MPSCLQWECRNPIKQRREPRARDPSVCTTERDSWATGFPYLLELGFGLVLVIMNSSVSRVQRKLVGLSCDFRRTQFWLKSLGLLLPVQDQKGYSDQHGLTPSPASLLPCALGGTCEYSERKTTALLLHKEHNSVVCPRCLPSRNKQ